MAEKTKRKNSRLINNFIKTFFIHLNHSFMTDGQGQGPKPGHEDQGQHLGQQKQESGEIGKEAAHAHAPGQQKDKVKDEDDEVEETEGSETEESGA